MSHALRVACDAVAGRGHRAPGRSPAHRAHGAGRVADAGGPRLHVAHPELKVLGADAPTTILTTDRFDLDRHRVLRDRRVGVLVVPRARMASTSMPRPAPCVRRAWRRCWSRAVASITSLLGAGVVDRLIVGLAPTVIGQGTDASVRSASPPSWRASGSSTGRCTSWGDDLLRGGISGTRCVRWGGR